MCINPSTKDMRWLGGGRVETLTVSYDSSFVNRSLRSSNISVSISTLNVHILVSNNTLLKKEPSLLGEMDNSRIGTGKIPHEAGSS